MDAKQIARREPARLPQLYGIPKPLLQRHLAVEDTVVFFNRAWTTKRLHQVSETNVLQI